MSNLNLIEDGLRTAFIDYQQYSELDYRPQFITNDYKEGKKVISTIEQELMHCDEFQISVAFITEGGITPLLQTLKELEAKGVKGQILTTDYLCFSEPKALRKLNDLSNVEVKMYVTGDNGAGFHTKGYMFHDDEIYKIIVGSSNLTIAALTVNKEWNIKVVSTESGAYAKEMKDEFNHLWNEAYNLDEWIETYTLMYERQKAISRQAEAIELVSYKLEPNEMQVSFVNNLNKLIEDGQKRALLISATGTGKTYASAFAMRDSILQPKRVLFMVHREEIARQALKSYRRIFGDTKTYGMLTGSEKNYDADMIFATVNTLYQEDTLHRFAKNAFDAIVVDEVHRAGAEGGMHQTIISYFEPKLYLGMTASPERPDHFDIFSYFDHNIAYEIRLNQALEGNMLCPFHYFGITDLEVNGKTISDTTEFNYLVLDNRVDHIIEKIRYYGYSGDRVKGLIFCSRNSEAEELSKKFNARGYRTVDLSGVDNQAAREDAIKRLTGPDNENALDYIFTVDIFNEGVDIPEINQVVMLRPTQSPIVFVQQLGRGLRKYQDKEYVVVLDFIGNYSNNFMIPIALSGDRSYNKDNMRRYVSSGSRVIPGNSSIHFDEITRKRIYESIDSARTNSMEILKESYKNLKYRLGHIPSMADFEDYGSVDVMKIINSKGSYYTFLCQYEPDYSVRISSDAEKELNLISNEFASGKSLYELLCIKSMIDGEQRPMKAIAECEISDSVRESVARNLCNEFYQDTVKANWPCAMAENVNDEVKITAAFKAMLEDSNFANLLDETIQLGLSRNEINYSNKYKDTGFQLYQKYTYKDVCRLLNWEKNVTAQNIGGYKYDADTKTLPVFINYEKVDGTATAYEDRFINSKELIALSKNQRRVDSVDADHIYKRTAVDADNRIYLFMRKNKDDNENSKEFYFLGEMKAVGEPKPTLRDGKYNAFEIHYDLEDAVREDIYEYIVG